MVVIVVVDAPPHSSHTHVMPQKLRHVAPRDLFGSRSEEYDFRTQDLFGVHLKVSYDWENISDVIVVILVVVIGGDVQVLFVNFEIECVLELRQSED